MAYKRLTKKDIYEAAKYDLQRRNIFGEPTKEELKEWVEAAELIDDTMKEMETPEDHASMEWLARH